MKAYRNAATVIRSSYNFIEGPRPYLACCSRGHATSPDGRFGGPSIHSWMPLEAERAATLFILERLRKGCLRYSRQLVHWDAEAFEVGSAGRGRPGCRRG
jgi:hypothetical protein